ncbi:MAG: hypothetical protein ACE5KA_05190 [Nitrososphaerales archaeon]
MKPTRAKAKRIAVLFFIVGGWGLAVSYMFGGNPFIVILSAVNLGLGGVFTLFYTKAKK